MATTRDNERTAVSDENRQHARRRGSEPVAWMTLGLALGWLLGLSASPVLAPVLSALLGAVAGAVAGIQSTRRGTPEKEYLRATALALLFFGVAVGAPVGIMARTHGWFEPIHTALPAQSSTTPSELPQPSQSATAPSDLQVQARSGVLWGVSASECQTYLAAADLPDKRELRQELRESKTPAFRELEMKVTDSAALATTVEVLCASIK